MANVARRYGVPREGQDGPAAHAPVILMVSGGADSTALAVLAATSALDIADGRGEAKIARERLCILHIDHQLRGEASDGDARFVEELARSLGIRCVVRSADVAALAEAGDGNVENAGREFRYRAAAELANSLSDSRGTPRSCARIVTAHTADDRAETFFMNAIKGSGPAGLSSIPRRRGRIVRPLLDRTHEELCRFLEERGIAWREDETNGDTAYLRAYVRHVLMPVVETRNPRIVSSLSSTCDILTDEDAYLMRAASRVYRDLVRRSTGEAVVLDADRLAATDVAIARRVVRMAFKQVAPDARFEARHIARALELVAAGRGSATIPHDIDVRVEHRLLFISSCIARHALESSWLSVPGTLRLPDGRTLEARLRPVPPGSDPAAVAQGFGLEWNGTAVLLDARRAGISAGESRLWVEPPRAGDVLFPLGMRGQSKKLSDLLCDARVPYADRPLQPVVWTGPDGAIVWVAGIRADERSRCASDTKLLLELRLSGPEGKL